jgi:hypothetical protein
LWSPPAAASLTTSAQLQDIGEWEHLSEYSTTFASGPLVSLVGVDPDSGSVVVLIRTVPEQVRENVAFSRSMRRAADCGPDQTAPLTPTGSHTDERIKTISNLSYRTLVRTLTHDYVGYLCFPRVRGSRVNLACSDDAHREDL